MTDEKDKKKRAANQAAIELAVRVLTDHLVPGIRDRINSPTVLDVMSERENQDQKWGKQRHAFPHWLAILQEEIGEASEAWLERRARTVPDDIPIREELVQIAAVAIAMLEAFDDGACR